MEIKDTKEAYIAALEKEISDLKREYNDIQRALALVLHARGPIEIHEAVMRSLSKDATIVASAAQHTGAMTLALVNGPADATTWRKK